MKNAVAVFNVLMHNVVKWLLLVEKVEVRSLCGKMWVYLDVEKKNKADNYDDEAYWA